MEKFKQLITMTINSHQKEVIDSEYSDPSFLEWVYATLKKSPLYFCHYYRLFDVIHQIPENEQITIGGYISLNTQIVFVIASDEAALEQYCDAFETNFQTYIIQKDDVELEQMIMHELLIREQTLSLAESCTGGMIISRLINASGASKVIPVSFVTYSEEAKQHYVGVRRSTIKKYTVVSSEVVEEMVMGLLRFSETDIGISVSGFAGGDVHNERDGLCYFAIASNTYLSVESYVFHGSRNETRMAQTTYILWRLLNLLRSHLLTLDAN